MALLATTALAAAAGTTMVAVAPASAAPMTFVVNTTGNASPGAPNGICDVDIADGRQCNLRDAINEANANPGVDTIAFGLASPYTIQFNTNILPITDPVIVDGTTQSGYNPSTGAVVRLDGGGVGNGYTGLTVTDAGSGSTIKGLTFTRWGRAINLEGNDSTVSSSFIGLQPTGTTTTLGNETGVNISGNDNTVGGTSANERNVIGHNTYGVRLYNDTDYTPTPGSTDGNTIAGNYIGVRANGASTAPNYYGILNTYATNTQVGTDGAGNVISGNSYMGVYNEYSADTTVSDNVIGMDASGATMTPNEYGVYSYVYDGNDEVPDSDNELQVTDNFVGGNRSANVQAIYGRVVATGNVVGSATQSSDGSVSYSTGMDLNSVDTGLVADNTISGNFYNGLVLSSATGVRVVRNKIGTNSAGTSAVGNGVFTGNYGIYLCGGSGNQIGAAGGDGNVIAGNGGPGILMDCSADETEFLGNVIGRGADGSTSLPNGGPGIQMNDANRSIVGDGTAGGSNLIADNLRSGIEVGSRSLSNAISRNVITNNGEIGIDLLGNGGVNRNDTGDADGGGNGLQNFPVLSQAGGGDGITVIKGSLNSRAGRSYRLEFYANDGCDPSGNGEGQRFLGSQTVTTNSSGNVNYSAKLPGVVLGAGEQVSATATDIRRDDTSEFSACREAIGLPSASVDDVTVNEGNSGVSNATFTVTLSAAPSVMTTLRASTRAGTATAGTDFDAADTTVTFAPGETSKTVSVPIRGDIVDEFDETFDLELSEPDNATIADPTGRGTITDDDVETSATITDVTITEPTGTTNATALSTVRLGRVSAKPVTIKWVTTRGTARSTDYVAASGTLTFAPGQRNATIPVQIKPDDVDEANETVFIDLSSPTNATLADPQGLITIVDSDPTRTIDVSDGSLVEGNSGTSSMAFTLSMSGQVGSTVSVRYNTEVGTAVSPEDFEARSGTVSFAAGTTTQTVTVPIVGDTVPEPDEVFGLVLTNPIGANLGDATGQGTIRNDD